MECTTHPYVVLLLKSELSPLCETQIALFISDFIPSSAHPGTSSLHNNYAFFKIIMHA